METFGEALRRRRTQSAYRSLRALADRTGYDWGYIGQVERGERTGSAEFAAVCDTALDAGGELVALYHGGQEADQRRRALLGTLTGLAVSGTMSPMITLEALRQGLSHATDADTDHWQGIARSTPPTSTSSASASCCGACKPIWSSCSTCSSPSPTTGTSRARPGRWRASSR
ncbi:helix-turn-helix domain-containing protein [Catenuloplanes atrovinosus]|uniref:Helix-turn-helix domain-containing protein n=1 Tax=Catenuloplanes atrovinosus TaxID=137266 RepID=A0AAE3YSC3_9ACTN|nr:helix-turn-helix transcriptional regulator [Catenuloplanes atrovinosus]MDR7277741.1 hypothetical protein [Catenuloplanes atrovinosus]